MKVVGKIIECLQGERFSQIMSGFDFDTASQITVLLYKATESGVSLSFVKVATDTYPDAGLITKRESDGKMIFTIDTTAMATGKYDIECRVDVAGVLAAIVKDRTEYLTVKESRT